MSSIVSIDTRGYDISMGPGVLRVGGGGGLAGNVYINGNVGIGVINPTARLDVNGSFKTSDAVELARSVATPNTYIEMNSRHIDFHTGTTLTDYDSRIIAENGNGTTGQGNIFIFSSTCSVASNTILLNGNVGIGTTTPTVALDVNGGITASWTSVNRPIQVIRNTTGEGASWNSRLSIVPYLGASGFNALSSLGDVGIIWGLNTGTNGNLVIAAHGQTAGGLKITSTGNVGIGTSSPAATLDVAGSVRAYNLPVGYPVPNAGGSISWVRLGVFTVSDQTGQMCIIKLYGETGYNANIDQSNTTTIFFKVGNGQSGSGLNPTGFAGDCYYYTEGKTTSLEAAPIWISNQAGLNARTFTLFIRLNAYNTNAFYTVERDQSGTSSWTHSYSFGTAPATTPSSTCLVSTQQYAILAPNIYLSGSTYRTPYIYASGSAIFTPTTASGTLKLLDNITIPAAYSTTQPIMYVSNGDLLANAAIIVSGYYSSQVTPIHAGVSYINSPLTATRINYMLVLP